MIMYDISRMSNNINKGKMLQKKMTLISAQRIVTENLISAFNTVKQGIL